ncbi:uncharacterized protein LOC130794816 [Actinidia eriantha]|uniref:uncharacterized protein LOC130794816 n=1 Tax=Actinidia eriantha TaxID=165200 RepID=UPI0025844DB5|nr:uncharacterized protein LOC130794816 [Actinidia eriantha]
MARLPDIETPSEIRNNRRIVSERDGTHVRASVPVDIQGRFHSRKGGTTQNVLATFTFDVRFTYILAGWEGSAHDSRVLDDALSRPRGFEIPEEIMKIESYDEVMLAKAFDYLVEKEKLAKAFMAKNDRLR